LDLLRRRHIATRAQARWEVTQWNDEYNSERMHSTNGMLSPTNYERPCATHRITANSGDSRAAGTWLRRHGHPSIPAVQLGAEAMAQPATARRSA
jgi:hypothetical protein